MNRRELLKVVAATGIAVAVSTSVISQAVAQHRFTRRMTYDDLNSMRKLSVHLVSSGGATYRHSLWISDIKWLDMTKSQREKIWHLAEHQALRSAGLT